MKTRPPCNPVLAESLCVASFRSTGSRINTYRNDVRGTLDGQILQCRLVLTDLHWREPLNGCPCTMRQMIHGSLDRSQPLRSQPPCIVGQPYWKLSTDTNWSWPHLCQVRHLHFLWSSSSAAGCNGCSCSARARLHIVSQLIHNNRQLLG